VVGASDTAFLRTWKEAMADDEQGGIGNGEQPMLALMFVVKSL
jgi:hypothetical protein